VLYETSLTSQGHGSDLFLYCMTCLSVKRFHTTQRPVFFAARPLRGAPHRCKIRHLPRTAADDEGDNDLNKSLNLITLVPPPQPPSFETSRTPSNFLRKTTIRLSC
jgi:hypothetical protein